MNLKISSPEGVIFNGDVEKITLPTEDGAITVLPNHIPLVSVLKPGVVVLWFKKQEAKNELDDFVHDGETFKISIGKGIVYVDGKNVSIVSSMVTKTPKESEQELQGMKLDLQKKIVSLREKGSIEEVEKWLMTLKKIEADIELARIKEKNK